MELRHVSIAILVAACHAPPAQPPPPVIGSAPAAPRPPREAPAEPRGDVAHELAWARARWPRELGAVDVGTPRDRFIAWVAPSATLPVWVTTPQLTCARGELLHRRDATDNETLELTVYTKETLTVREYETADVAGELELGGAGGSQTRGPHGTWQPAGGWMRTDQGSMGHLSKVTDDVAQFAGVWVDISASCGGPATTLPCGAGGTITCSSCTDVAIHVKHRDMGMIRVVHMNPLPDPSCPRCPATPPNAELDRVQALLGQIDPWVTEPHGASTIFRSLERCRAARDALSP